MKEEVPVGLALGLKEDVKKLFIFLFSSFSLSWTLWEMTVVCLIAQSASGLYERICIFVR